MNRKLKGLGLGILAATAISVVMSMNASAQVGGHFTFEETNTTLKGTEDPKHPTIFHITGGSVECEKATYEGTALTGADKTLTSVRVKANYEGCWFEEIPVEVTMNSCEFIFTVREKEVDTKDSTVQLECKRNLDEEIHNYATGNDRREMIEIHVPGVCSVTIPGQTPTSGGVIYKTGGTGKTHDIDVTATVEGLHSTRHGFCNLFGPTNKTHTDGSYTGQATVKGFNSKGEQIGITATGV